MFFVSFIKLNSNGQVVINEVMNYPTNPQGLITYNGNTGKEYIELYNPSCNSINVAGYFIASRQDFAGSSGGGFRIPNVPAAIISPNGHLVIGTSNSSQDPNNVDIKIPSFTTNYCQNSPTQNFILANADGWVGLFDTTGVPVDAIYWSSSASNISQNADYGGVPCTPPNSPSGVILKSAQQINSGFPGVLNYVGNTPTQNQTFSRIPDGGPWQRNIVSSINDSNVGGNCNGGNCLVSSTFNTMPTIVQPSCNTPNGIISFNPQPTGTYFYLWPFPTNMIVDSVGNLPAGTYPITITGNGCSKDTTIILSAGNGPTAVAITKTDPGCGQSNGSINVGTVTGGVAPYTFSLNGSAFASATNYTNLGAGTYTVTVKDANGCEFVAQTTTLTNPNGPTAVAITKTDPGCGQINGSITVGAVTGGVAPYTFSLNGSAFASATNYPNLGAGTYTVTVKDANGCEYVGQTTTLTNPNGPTAVAINKTDPGCGQSNGTISVGNVTGGTSPYTYSLNGSAFTTTTNYSNLGAGTYTVTVKDANGCEFIGQTTTLTNPNGPTNITFSTTNAKCDGTGGSLIINNTTGGTAPYTYSFNGSTFTATINYTNLTAATYPVIVKDANGCEFTKIVTVTANSPLNASFSAEVQSSGNDTLTEITANSGYNSSYLWNYSSQNETLNAVFVNTSSTGTGVTYNWIFNNGQVTDTTTTNLNNLIQNFQGPNSLDIILIVTNGDASCNDTTKILIEVKSTLVIPNIFSPNGDGINDVFLIKYRGYKDLQLSVFNRWGNKFYETTKPEEGWNGNDAAEGTYFYVITGKSNYDKNVEEKGYFMLVR